MAQLTIQVIKALYGAPGGQAVDVTSQAQQAFQETITTGSDSGTTTITASFTIGLSTFGLQSSGLTDGNNEFTMVFSLSPGIAGATYFRAGKDGDAISVMVSPPNQVSIIKAVYATNALGVDVTENLSVYLGDPTNSSVFHVGCQAFLDALTGGASPSPGTTMYFSVIYRDASNTVKQLACTNHMTINIS